MKRNILLLSLLAAATTFSSCDKDFLNRLPQTTITKENTFKSVNDLELYTNAMYGMIGPSYNDGFTDNLAGMAGASTTDNMVRGNLTVSNAGGWGGWDQLRRFNFMLTNLENVKGVKADIDHYVGIARMYRANWYYNMVLSYGDVPWYDKVLKDTDEELMQKNQDPRTFIVERVMEDLDFAVKHMKAGGSNTRVNKWTALTLMSRIALTEASYRKYHTYLGLNSTANSFYEKSAAASKQIIDGKQFSIANTGKPAEDYRNLFASPDLSANKEIIYLKKSSLSEGIANNSHTVFDYEWAMSKSLMEEYLMKDGTRFTDQQGYETKYITELFKDRDPRLSELIMEPGFRTNPALPIPHKLKPTYGGYLQVKFYPRDPELRKGWGLNYTDLPVMRYAEILLNYAEAKAELGNLSQSEADASIGELRRRAGLPNLDVAGANAKPDPILAKRYPNVDANKGLILEIRRERRTELAAEGFRYTDINRWHVGELFAESPKGMYVPALGALDVTGDGIPDIAILAKKEDLEPMLAGLNITAEQKKEIVPHYLSDDVIYLSEGTKGHIMFTRDKKQPRKWEEGPMYYYRPIPIGQTVLNPNLKQPFGWK